MTCWLQHLGDFLWILIFCQIMVPLFCPGPINGPNRVRFGGKKIFGRHKKCQIIATFIPMDVWKSWHDPLADRMRSTQKRRLLKKNANKKITPTKKRRIEKKNLSTQSKVENNYRLVLLRFESPTPRMKKWTKLIFLREPVTQNQPESESLNLIFLFESQLNVFCFEFAHNILIQKL